MTILPPEIRCTIYRFVFAGGLARIEGGTWSRQSPDSDSFETNGEGGRIRFQPAILPASFSIHEKTSAGLLLASKARRADALPIFWQSLTLQVGEDFEWLNPKLMPLFALNDSIMRSHVRVLDEIFYFESTRNGPVEFDVVTEASVRRRMFPMLRTYFSTPMFLFVRICFPKQW